MNKENISILSIFINFFLACLKLGVGSFVKSAALIADGIHSGLDVVSSFTAYIGTKIAKKPADKEHPYGHAKAETIAGFIITFLLLISALWIILEGVQSIVEKKSHIIGSFALVVVVISIIVNEIMARLKFKIGRKEDSLALIADAEHSRADSISSIAVLIGLFMTRFCAIADGLTAVFVGLYILYETYNLSREMIDNLLDVSNPEIEKQIKNICEEEEINLFSIKTRKLGFENFAEIKIGLNEEWRMEKVSEVIKSLEKILLFRIKHLKFVVVQVTSHHFRQGYMKSTGGKITHFKNLIDKVELEKLGFRTVISFKNNKFYYDFGAIEYLIVDQDKKGNILQKKVVKNSYFVVGKGHGIRFMKSIKADRVVTCMIGQNAKNILKKMGIQIEIISRDTTIEQILTKLKTKQNYQSPGL